MASPAAWDKRACYADNFGFQYRMANAVFIQNRLSNYKDRLGEHYHFPKRYLGVVEETVGDWVVFYESRKDGGAFGYVAVQKVLAVREDRELEGHYYAILVPATELSFEQTVPRGRQIPA